MIPATYVGKELDIFANAIRWKKYWSSKILPYLTGDVLEVGSGQGTNTAFLKSAGVSSWTCLEPDPELVLRTIQKFQSHPLLTDCRVETGTTATIGSNRQFDAILYIDVLEHIENDHLEMQRASQLLRRGGKIIVLAPAHQWLYTPFDRAVGHFRRYDKSSLSACTPSGCKCLLLDYLDSAGLAASLINRLALQQDMPSLSQILFWDRLLVPVSQLLDLVTFSRVGKSILGIWEKY
ncbi:MAG TPA: class I SAM-dependent methyltransferase [Candidatus Saccharimonadales bacterium]|jgi:SAM-dependent methyltransferase|nr:class I SAM-dependent methyltransferase [Candidatus Saccharimonadales bacterium]